MIYRKPKSKMAGPREFVGAQPRNRNILDVIRKDGYLGVMFNNDDLLDAVIWSSNYIDAYERHCNALGERVVIPMSELGDFRKKDLIDAYLILIIYYHRRSDFMQVEALKTGFMTVAKFQELPEEDVKIMKHWDAYMEEVKKRMEQDDFSAPEMDMAGTGNKYEHYKTVVQQEQERFKEELRKEKGLRVD